MTRSDVAARWMLGLFTTFVLGTTVRAADAQAWTARWIWTQPSTPNQWVAFRKTVSLERVPEAAPTRIAADTKYWLYVNGALVVFEGGLKGGPNPSDIYYDRLDIARYLHPGQNTIAILVWHLGKDGLSHKSRGAGAGGLIFESDVAAGVTLTTDASWRSSVHPAYRSNAAGSQPNSRLPESNIYYDARAGAAMERWTEPVFDDSRWPSAADRGAAGSEPWNALIPRPTPLFRFSDLQPYANAADLPHEGTGRAIVARLPSNLQVTPYLVVDAPAGAVINIDTDHYLDGGAPNVRSTYITRGGVQEFESLGWMSGTAVRYTMPRGLRILGLGYRESGFDTRFAGSFTSGDAFLDSLWQKAARTLYVNMRDTYLDCPTRERAQWWGDVVNQIRAGAYVFDSTSHSLAGAAIRELVAWRRPGGELSSPIPAATGGPELPQQMLASIWGSWQYYVLTGDSSWMTDAYEPFAEYLDHWKLDATGLVVHRAGEWDWQDWGTNIDVSLLDNAWYAMAAEAVAEIARVRGDASEEARWRTRRSQINDAFDRLWDGSRQAYRSPGYRGDTDDRGNALAVVAGLVPQSRYAAVTTVLRQHWNASPYMEFYALEALYLMDAPDDALRRMVLRYAPQVIGADSGPTLWEMWKVSDGSRNHGWSTGPLYALSAHVAGVRPTAPGYSRFEFRPQLGSLTPALHATVPTAYGDITVDVDATAMGRLTMNVTAPSGTRARIAVPRSGLSALRLSVNGTEVYANGRSTVRLPGLTYAGENATDVLFDVEPGAWTLERK